MLPFLKNKQEASVSMDEEPSEDYGSLDAICDDLLSAIQSSDKGVLKAAIQSLIDHIKSEDETQDETLLIEE
jgi:hypothetical protein